MRYLLVPDSFKGTLSSQTICDVMKQQILAFDPAADVRAMPVADGGEGSVDAYLTALGGEKIEVLCHGPRMEERTSFYGMLPGQIAVIEMAAAAGLPLMGKDLDVAGATTYGVGELMADAIKKGAKRMILALGGSATNDGCCGAACALGVRFLKEDGTEFLPTGGTLNEIASIDLSGRVDLPPITVMCDIDNPLCGPLGAAAIFGPQKGATPEMIPVLDSNLHHLSDLMIRDLGVDILNMPGAGAAGGMGGGSVAFFGGVLQMGIETLLDTVHFDDEVKDADYVFTGEGRLDLQSVHGKVLAGVARRSKKANVPVIAVVGSVGEGADGIYPLGITAVFSTNHAPQTFDEVKPFAKENLERTMKNVMALLTAKGRH